MARPFQGLSATITTSPTRHPPVISRYNNSSSSNRLDVNVVFLIISNLIITGILNTISATINLQHLTVCAIIIGTTITLNTSTRITKINHRQLPQLHPGRIIRIHRRCGPAATNTMTTIIRILPHRPPRVLPYLPLPDLQVQKYSKTLNSNLD